MDKKVDLLSAGSWAIYDHLFVLERLPTPGDTVNFVSPVSEVDDICWGGVSFNCSVTAARLGLKSGVLGVEGEDFNYGGYRSYLEQFGVDLSGVTVLKGERSGHGFIFSDPAGNGIVLGNLGAARRQADYEADKDLILAARALIVGPTFDRFTLDAAEFAKRSGLVVAVNGSLSTWPEYAGGFVKAADILFNNHFEMRRLARLLGMRSEKQLLGYGPRVLYITEGTRGATVVTAQGRWHVPSVPARTFVDPTGAGDAFAGACMAGILLGFDHVAAARIGATVSSFVVEEKGSQTNLPDWDSMSHRYEAFFGEALALPQDRSQPMNDSRMGAPRVRHTKIAPSSA